MDLSASKSDKDKLTDLNRALVAFRVSFNVYSKQGNSDIWSETKNIEGYTLTKLGDVLGEKKYYFDAKKSIQDALEIQPENHAFLDSMGWVEYV